GQDIVFAHDVDVPLEVLAESPALRALVAEELGDGEPADGLAQTARTCTHHPCECRGHFRPQCDRTSALVLEVIELMNDLLAALLDVELQRLERRPIVFLETVAARHLAPHRCDVRPNGEVLRVEIPESW